MSNYVVLLRGPPGVGKSTAAEKLIEFLPSPVVVIHKDVVQFHFPHKGEIPVDKLILVMMRALLRRKINVIIDGLYGGPDSAKRILRLKRTARGLRSKFAVIVLDADKNTCLKRNEKRKKRIPRSDMHKWYDYFKKAKQNYLVVNTVGKSQKQTFKEVLKLLKVSGI